MIPAPRLSRPRAVAAKFALPLCLALSSCSKNDESARIEPIDALALYTPREIGDAWTGEPWVTHVNATDLDRDGLHDVIFCEGLKHQVTWLRQRAGGTFEEIPLSREILAPVRTEAVDIDQDGDLDVIVSSMGVVFPNNDTIGSIYILENDGNNGFVHRQILKEVARVTDVRAADFDGDGRLDLAVAQFGYDQGQVRWMRNLGDGAFESEILLDLSGAIHACVGDMDGDGDLDIVALISQEWEEIYLFSNDGKGNFSQQPIYGSTNQDFGSSGISLADVNADGRLDVLYTNGDGFDLARPGPRPWHGLQWLKNLGGNAFQYHRIADFPGAYSPLAGDFDGDGDLDIAAVSASADWTLADSVSLAMYRNDGDGRFAPLRLARSPTHLVAVDAADFDGDGRLELVTAGLHAYPPFDRMSRVTIWTRND